MKLPVSKYKLHNLEDFSPYFSNGIEISAWYRGDYYVYLKITNTMTLEETKAYFSEVDKKLAEVKQIFTDDLSEAEKALALYDYLVYECEYDYDNLVNGTVPRDSYKSGGILMKGTGVCQAYAYAYMYIMNSIGIECYATISNVMNHVWNIIKIDGSYYHVDCTWGDPIPDRMGVINHEYFLLSDSLIQEREHSGWDLTKYVCNSTKYDHAYWENISSQIITVGDYTYYIQGGSIQKRDNTNQTVTELKYLGRWYVWESSSYWIGSFSGLFLYDNELYYNTSKEIRKFH